MYSPSDGEFIVVEFGDGNAYDDGSVNTVTCVLTVSITVPDARDTE